MSISGIFGDPAGSTSDDDEPQPTEGARGGVQEDEVPDGIELPGWIVTITSLGLGGLLVDFLTNPYEFIIERVVRWVIEQILGLIRVVVGSIIDTGNALGDSIWSIWLSASATASVVFGPFVDGIEAITATLIGGFTGLGIAAPAATLAATFIWFIFIVAIGEFLVRLGVFSVLENIPVVGIVFSAAGRFVFFLAGLPSRVLGRG